LGHAEEGLTGDGGVGAEAEEVELVEGDCLRVEIEGGVGMGAATLMMMCFGAGWPGLARSSGLAGSGPDSSLECGPSEIGSCAPGSVAGADCVKIEAHAPVGGRVVRNYGTTDTKAVLRGDTASRDVETGGQ